MDFEISDREAPPARLGVARLTKLAYGGADLTPLWNELRARVVKDPADAGALMDLSLIAQLTGNPQLGQLCQEQALRTRQIYRLAREAPPARLRLLALCAAVDIGTNMPLEFLVQDSDVDLCSLYIVPGSQLAEPPCEHDVAIVAVPDSDANRPTLTAISKMLEAWPRPVLNRPDRIALLERDRFFALLSDAPGVAIPPTARLDRDRLETIAAHGDSALSELGGAAFPLIIRPVGSQAGKGLDLIDSAAALADYLSRQEGASFFLSPFVNYKSSDGLFRKYRIAFVGGKPYPCHMAIGSDWSLWYLNAGMEADARKRAEEQKFLLDFDKTFGARHAIALSEIARRVGLDYFAIDCAETADGKLLLFEGDIAMIVHDMDSPEIFPYKAPAMRRLFGSFVRMLHERAKTAGTTAA